MLVRPCVLFLLATASIGAAMPPARPVVTERPANVVDINFLTRLLEGNGGQRQSSSHRRARPSQGRNAIPAPPALADVPIPLPKPGGPLQAGTAAISEQAQRDAAKDVTPKDIPEKDNAQTAGPAPEKPGDDKTSVAAEPRREQAKQPEAPKAEESVVDPPVPASNAAQAQANPPAISEVPTPLPKPEENPSAEQPATTTTDAGPKPDGKEKEEEKAETSPPPPPLVKEDPEELKACLAELTTLGAKFEPTDPINDGNGCGIEHPIDVAEVLPGVSLGGATMRCKTAVTMAHWLKDTVQPAMSIAMPGRKITGIVPGSTYACRLRNSAATGKISEHARGNAFDVAAFKLDNGEKMEMKPRDEDSTLEGAFQRTATAGACLHFTTVLSPGSDAAHETHLHLDVLDRKGGYRYCR